MKFHPQDRHDNGYVLTLGDKRIYIAGDTEETPEMKALTGIDVAFLPMNLPYTMSIEQAAQAVKDFKPKIVYPYHYAGSDVAPSRRWSATRPRCGSGLEVVLRRDDTASVEAWPTMSAELAPEAVEIAEHP